jgi:RNA methyltransferase, TrmH family
MKRLTSRHHPLVTTCRTLARRRDADDPRILLDGLHLVQDACRSGIRIDTAAVSDDLLAHPETASLVASLERAGANLVEVTGPVLEAMSPVKTPSGIVALAERPSHVPDDILAIQPALVLVAVDVQDPGNVGAIARAAEAGGATGLLLCGASADPFGWKALRGSMGSLLRLPAAGGLRWSGVLQALKRAGTRIVATEPRAEHSLFDADLAGSVAFLLGGEGPGLPADALAAADLRLAIPMRAPVESLNVAVAAALLTYEAARRRAGKGRP